jgi:uncharacterized protein YjbJ (UPF0337 family)
LPPLNLAGAGLADMLARPTEERMMARPDLQTPQGRSAYVAELGGIARGWRYTGLILVTLGAIELVQVERTDAPWSQGLLGPATIAALAIRLGGHRRRDRHTHPLPPPPHGWLRRNRLPPRIVWRPACFSRRCTMGELTDKIKGNVNEALGKAKQQSDDADTRDEGAGQELKGKAEQVKGAVKGAFGNKI